MTESTTDPDVTQVLETLQNTTTDGLLTAFAALTHRIHAAEHPTPRLTIIQSETVTNLRAQRDLIRTEILSRTGDL